MIHKFVHVRHRSPPHSLRRRSRRAPRRWRTLTNPTAADARTFFQTCKRLDLFRAFHPDKTGGFGEEWQKQTAAYYDRVQELDTLANQTSSSADASAGPSAGPSVGAGLTVDKRRSNIELCGDLTFPFGIRCVTGVPRLNP